jgi:hypothetical protein
MNKDIVAVVGEGAWRALDVRKAYEACYLSGSSRPNINLHASAFTVGSTVRQKYTWIHGFGNILRAKGSSEFN